ncbi:MAG: hypothetical protein ABT940_11475 [Alphaproteobacteria bacterium]
MPRVMSILPPVAVILGLCACSTPEPGSPEAAMLLAAKEREARASLVKDSLDDVPSWYLEVPKDNVSLYAPGTAVSPDMQMALDKAILTAKRTLADSVSSAVSSKMKQFAAETGSSDDPELLTETNIATINLIAEANVAGYSREQTKISPSGTNFRAYVLLRYPLGEANRMLVAQIKRNRILEAKLGASKAFQDLEKDIAAARQAQGATPGAAAKPVN